MQGLDSGHFLAVFRNVGMIANQNQAFVGTLCDIGSGDNGKPFREQSSVTPCGGSKELTNAEVGVTR